MASFGLALPEDASAGLLSDGGGDTLDYRPLPTLEAGQSYDVIVERVGPDYRITDRGTAIEFCPSNTPECDPPPCEPGATVHEALCDSAEVGLLFAILGDSNDRIENRTDLLLAACGGKGQDSLFGGSGTDDLGGGAGRDDVHGGAGNDLLAIDLGRILAPAVPACAGGDRARFDLIDGGPGKDRIEGGPGDDLLRGADHDDIITGYDGDDRLDGGAGGDILLAVAGSDIVAGGPDDDYVFGGAGNDDLDGGEGDDVLGKPVRYDADGLAPGKEVVTTPEDGDDRLDGGPGDDSLDAGPGSLVFSLVNVEETLAALRSGVVDRKLESPVLNGADHYVGGPGDDIINYANRARDVDVTLDGLANDGSSGEGDGVDLDVESVGGGAGDDHLRAAPAGSLLFGDLGADTIQGGGGPDILAGGFGPEADHLVGAAGDDELLGGPGDDVLSGGRGRDALTGGGDDDELTGGQDSDSLEGGSGSDRLDGGADSDCLEGFVVPAGSAPAPCPSPSGATPAVGADGDDLLQGGGGIDRLAGGPGDDVADYSGRTHRVQVLLPGAGGRWAAASSSGEDVLAVDVEGARGGRGNDLLVGNGKDNLLDGGPGDDQVQGGSGVDRLRGGSGRDFLVAHDRSPDAVRCGTKRDLAIVDSADEVVSSLSDVCEHVQGGGARSESGAPLSPAPGCVLPFRLRGTGPFFLLGTRAVLPAGTVVDASRCAARLQVTNAAPARRPPALLSRGAFSVHPFVDGLELRLRGALPERCGDARVVVRRLRVQAAPVGLVVSGRFLGAKGPGASWMTVDRCASTAVRVERGRVRVLQERGRARTVLGAGERHVTRRPRPDRKQG